MNFPRVLMLNASYMPLAVVSWSKAISLIFQGKAISVMDTKEEVRSPSQTFKIPSIIQLKTNVFFMKSRVRLCKRTILERDGYTCQYCYKEFSAKHLNLDHVIPASKGGKRTWTNMVTSCIPCNSKKADRTPEQAKMNLLRKPDAPFWTVYDHIAAKSNHIPEEWAEMFPVLRAKSK